MLNAAPKPVAAPRRANPLLVPQLARQLSQLGSGMGQLADERSGSLGFGYLYYSLARLYQPQTVVCIGAYRGFAPVAFALALAENGAGNCYFVDPGIVDRHWHNPAQIAQLNHRFGLGGRLRHLHRSSQQVIAEACLPEPIDLLYIDGDHSYAGVKFDFEQFGALVRPGGLILLHDSTAVGVGFTPWEVQAFLTAEVHGDPRYELLTLPLAAGLTIVRKCDEAHRRGA